MQHLSPNPCMTENIQDQEVQSRPVSSHSCDCVFHSHDRPCRSSEEGADRGAQQGVDRHAFERIGPRKDSVRQETPWKNVPAGLGFRSSVDSVVCKPLPPQQRLQSPQVLDVRGEESSRTGIHRGDCSQDKWRSRRDHTDASSSQGQDDTKGQESSLDSNGPLRGRLHGGGVRSDQWDRPESCVPITRSAGCGCVAVSDAQPRECHDRDHFSPEESAAAAVDCNPDRTILLAGDHDVDFPEHLEPFCSGPTEKKKFQNLVRQYEREYQELRPQHRPKTFRKSDLIEVFCGPQSTLTDQGNKQGLRAQRFTLNNGDLHTQEGRRNLFVTIIEEDPSHLWYSPVCRPWSAWSFLNGSLSRDAWTQLYADRLKGLEQVALGIVLFRIQTARHHHMHWEQPSRSLMFRLPHMQEVFAYTKMAEFDLCEVANYQDPKTLKHIKKGLLLCTTSQKMFECFHGRKCRRNHDHQPIEGSTIHKGESISRSRFSESYPRKFVRQIIHVLQKTGRSEVPFADAILASTISEAEGPASKRPRIRAAPAVAPRWIEPSELPCVKRRKLDKQADPTPSLLDDFSRVFKLIDSATPRVGKVTHHSTEPILQSIQKWFPEKVVVMGVSCRGTDRLQTPPKELHPDEAPLRITISCHRTNGKYFVTETWEEWQHLAQRQLVRSSGCPARLSITVFARNPDKTSVSPSQELNVPGAEPMSVPGPTQHMEGERPVTIVDRNLIDANSDKQGPKFAALSASERQTIVKCHENLGHPSADRLKTLMKQQNFRPEMIEAIDDFRCSICQEAKGPTLSRPAADREPADFNDRVSMDGIVWENKQGTAFHFYHVIDYATSFQAAGIAPNRTTDRVLQFLATQWISWAGPPNSLTVDSATELNSHEMDDFCQGLNIHKHTITPEAHWQNSKIERHGQVLQHMLSKYQEDHPILTYTDLQIALAVCVAAKNASTLKRGFTPEMLVLGKRTRLPGSICGDDSIASHSLADSELAQGAKFREQLARREAAYKAFWEADNSAALRRALLRRSRPSRGQYSPGEWIMAWKQSKPPKGQWIGPLKVVIQAKCTHHLVH